jgi:nicotinate-nucleotide adenylyltransferase
MATSERSARKVGLFGGMFDPPHIGHLIVASEAAWQLGLDEVRLVVCARPPHREPGWLPAEFRLRLVEAAVAGELPLVASRAEVDRPGQSYTVDTLEGFTADEPDATFALIVGADQLLGFHRWRTPERITELASLAAVGRGGADRDAIAAAAKEVSGGVTWVEMPEVAVSSTMIRERLQLGRPIRHLVPRPVEDLLAHAGFPSHGSVATLRRPLRPT